MSSLRSLRGGCHCGRNSYIIQVPQDANDTAQVLFNSDSLHVSPLAAPLAAFLRVPLSWYQSTTHAFFPDETHAMIRRVFEAPTRADRPSKRHFCGFCGTPLSFWTERPRSEADFIQLTLATLCDDNLRDLEDLGLLPSSEDATPEDTEAEMEVAPATKQGAVTASASRGREYRGVPWFDSLVEGSRLGRMHRRQGFNQSQDGSTRVEWEIMEWTEGDEEEEPSASSDDVDMLSNPGKRKRAERADSDANPQDMH